MKSLVFWISGCFGRWSHIEVPLYSIKTSIKDTCLATTVELLGTDTSLLRTVFNVPTKFSYFSFKKPSIIRTLSNTDNGH